MTARPSKRRGRPKLLEKSGGATGLGTPLNVGSIMATLMDQHGLTFEQALEHVREHHAMHPSRNTAAKYYRHYHDTVAARAAEILKDRTAITAADVARVQAERTRDGLACGKPADIRRSIARNRAMHEFAERESLELDAARAERHKYAIVRTIYAPAPWNPARVRKAIEGIAADEEARLAKFDPSPPALEVTITYRPAPKKSRKR